MKTTQRGIASIAIIGIILFAIGFTFIPAQTDNQTASNNPLQPLDPSGIRTNGGVFFLLSDYLDNGGALGGPYPFLKDTNAAVYSLNGSSFLVDEGDLRVFISRPAHVKQSDKYTWSFSIEGIDGGLLETNDEFMFLAPESGYESKFQMKLNPVDPDWTSLVKKRFFIRSRNGQIYGWMQIEVNSIYNLHSAIEITYAVNPSGSRNLQP